MATEEDKKRRAARLKMTAEERKHQIVTTAASLFDQAGYSTTTMDDIAQAVGVAKPTLYHYFDSKDRILAAIHEEFIDLLISRHDERATAGLKPEQLLLEVMADILELMETHRGHVRVFFNHHRELPVEVQATMRAKRDDYERMVENLYIEGMAEGTFRKADAKLASLATFGMCNWAYQWFRPGGPMRTREIAYQFWGFLVHGLENPETRRALTDVSTNARVN